MHHLTTSIKTQVIIVGAGPTGLSLAAQLLRYGIDFLIVDQKAGVTELSKAVVVQARTLEIFQEIGLAKKAVDEGAVTTGINLYYKGKRQANIDITGLGEGLSAFPYALSLEQSKTEMLLANHLAENGKQVQWNTAVISFEQDAEGVRLISRDSAGTEQVVEADYLVGCDGARSIVRHQLGLGFEGTTEPKLFYVADVVVTSTVINRDELYMFMIKKGFVLFFPMEGEGHYRIVGILPGAKDLDEEFQFTDIEPTTRESIVVPIQFEKLRWFSTYKVHSRKSNSFMQGRCFLAGDAAHIHTPAGGQGMNTGIQDAYNLAWKLAFTLRNGVNTDVLKSYDSERQENARHLLRTTDRMFDIMSGINPFWNFLRLNFFPLLLKQITRSKAAKKKIFPLLSQIGIAYPDSSLTVPSSVGKVKAGDRMHYFVFNDGTQIFSYLEDPVFKLLFFGSNQNPFEGLQSTIPYKAFSFEEIPGTIFHGENNFYIVLRPDNHVSYIGKEIGKCRELFEWFGANRTISKTS